MPILSWSWTSKTTGAHQTHCGASTSTIKSESLQCCEREDEDVLAYRDAIAVLQNNHRDDQWLAINRDGGIVELAKDVVVSLPPNAAIAETDVGVVVVGAVALASLSKGNDASAYRDSLTRAWSGGEAQLSMRSR